MDLVGRHRRVMQTSLAVVAGVAAHDLDRPTPCAQWSLGELLAHLIGQNHGFAAAAEGAGPDLALFAPRPVGDDFVQAYAESARRVTDAFAACQWDGLVWLPEVTLARQLPVTLAVRFHLVDYVVHSWDVARSLGRTVDFDDDVLAEALSVAEQVPDGENRRREGASFHPALAAPADASVLDRTLARLGRDPAWPS